MKKLIFFLGREKRFDFFLRNIFVSRHGTDALIVKLGDAGIPDYSDPAEIHFLAIEMFTTLNHKSCTTKGKTPIWKMISLKFD